MIKPISDHIVIEPSKVEEKTKGGIFLPQGAENNAPSQGVVIAVGPGRPEVPMEVKVGDKVVFTKYGHAELKVDGKEYVIVGQEEILAVIQ